MKYAPSPHFKLWNYPLRDFGIIADFTPGNIFLLIEFLVSLENLAFGRKHLLRLARHLLTREKVKVVRRLVKWQCSRPFKVGAASKGIIQRDFQHHATVFRSAYAKNPFDNVTDDELREYQRVVDAKSRNGELRLVSRNNYHLGSKIKRSREYLFRMSHPQDTRSELWQKVIFRFAENPYPMSPTLDSTGEATQGTASGAGAVTSPTSDTEADGD